MRPDPDLHDWLRLTLVPGIGPERQRQLLATFGPPDRIFAASRLAIAAVIGERLADSLLGTDNSAAIARALVWAQEPDNQLLTLADPVYPQALLQTADPPTLIYAKGRVELLNCPALAVVGSRNATPQGMQNAEAFSAALADAGLCIVSGLALGVDTAAHRGGLRSEGRTIAVIGTGADRVYPARNASLAREIAKNGVILSEFALGTPAAAHNFPRRNRLIAGLAKGTLVVEAAPGSGSLITARLAGELGREVFAIPGSIHSPLSKGCHQLIKSGAKLVESAQDVLEELRWPALGAAATSPTQATQAHRSPEEARVLAALGHDPQDVDTLVQRSGLTPDALFVILTALELEQCIGRLPGNRFQRLE